MLYSHFRQGFCHNVPAARGLENNPLEWRVALLSKGYIYSINRLCSLKGVDKKIQATLTSHAAAFVVMSLLCGAPAAYFIVNESYLLGVWAVSAFLAWGFLQGAAVATKKSAHDNAHKGETRTDKAMSTVMECRSKPMDLTTNDRASRQRRSAEKISPLAKAQASKQSRPLWFTEGEELSGRRTLAVSPRSRSTL